MYLLLWNISSWPEFIPGDSACIIPSANISEENLKTIKEYTKKIAEEMHVRGLMNMQYAIQDGKVYVLEANPRASRTVPLVSKVCNIAMVPLATQIITSEFTQGTFSSTESDRKENSSLRSEGSSISI